MLESPGKADMRILIKNGEELTGYETSGGVGEGQGRPRRYDVAAPGRPLDLRS